MVLLSEGLLCTFWWGACQGWGIVFGESGLISKGRTVVLFCGAAALMLPVGDTGFDPRETNLTGFFDWFRTLPVCASEPHPKPEAMAPEVKAQRAGGKLTLKALPSRPLGPAVVQVATITAPTRRTWTPPAPVAPGKPGKSHAQRKAEEAALERRRLERLEQAPPKGLGGSILGRRGMHGGTGPNMDRHLTVVVTVPEKV